MKKFCACTLGFAIFSALPGLRAQTIPPFNPPKTYTPTKMNLYTSMCGLWRTDQTFESAIRLSNQLVTSPMDATVTLFMADGTPYVLPVVHLEKKGVATVSVNEALANAPAEVLAHISSFGSASVSYRYDWQGVVYAAMSILDIPRSLQYTYPFAFPMKSAGLNMEGKMMPSTTEEGLVWSYSKHSEAFLAFSNSSSREIQVKLSRRREDEENWRDDAFAVPAKNTVLKPLKINEDGTEHALGGIRIALMRIAIA